jgi:uncharacterized membrane protein YphA (DoxX/SURF4 family)
MMTIAVLGGQLLLAILFALSGLAKLADRKGTQKSLREFGAPTALAPALAILLPVVELALAGALVPSSTARWGAAGIFALLIVFIGGVGYNMARGRAPECHCFGQLHSEPAGWPILRRNTLLASIAAAIVVAGPGINLGHWLSSRSLIEVFALAAAVLVFALFAVQGWFLIQILRQNGRLLLRIEALEDKDGSRTDTSLPAVH